MAALTLDDVENQIIDIRNKLLQKKGEKKLLEDNKKTTEKNSNVLKLEYAQLEQSKQLLMDTIKHAREEASSIFESLVTQSLQYVFDNIDISFKIDIKDLKNRTDCDFYIIENGELMDPVDSNGGGIIDIISLILRIALRQANNYLSLSEDTDNHIQNNGPLILDEPFKHLSAAHISRIGSFLRKISEELEIQIIIVTHNKELMTYGDKQFIVFKDDKFTTVEEV